MRKDSFTFFALFCRKSVRTHYSGNIVIYLYDISRSPRSSQPGHEWNLGGAFRTSVILFAMRIHEQPEMAYVHMYTVLPGEGRGGWALLRSNISNLVNSIVYLWSLYCVRPAHGVLMQMFFPKLQLSAAVWPLANYAEQQMRSMLPMRADR